MRRRRGVPEMTEAELREKVAEDERLRLRGRGPFEATRRFQAFIAIGGTIMERLSAGRAGAGAGLGGGPGRRPVRRRGRGRRRRGRCRGRRPSRADAGRRSPPSASIRATRTATPIAEPSWRAMPKTAVPVAKRSGGRRGGGGCRQRPQGHPDPGAAEHEAGQEGGRVLGRGADRGEDVGEAGGKGEAAGRGHRPLADPGPEAARGDREGRRHQRPRGEGEAGLQRRVAPDFGQQQDAGEQHRPEAGEEDGGGEVGEGEGADPQQRQLDHRGVVVGGAETKATTRAEGGGERAERARVRPAPFRALDDAEGEQADAERQLGGAEQVGAAVLGFADLVQGAERDAAR